jgi:hypothetical protein
MKFLTRIAVAIVRAALNDNEIKELLGDQISDCPVLDRYVDDKIEAQLDRLTIDAENVNGLGREIESIVDEQLLEVKFDADQVSDLDQAVESVVDDLMRDDDKRAEWKLSGGGV